MKIKITSILKSKSTKVCDDEPDGCAQYHAKIDN